MVVLRGRSARAAPAQLARRAGVRGARLRAASSPAAAAEARGMAALGVGARSAVFVWLLTVGSAAAQVPFLAEERLRLPAGLPPAVDLVVADLDGNGRLDLVRIAHESIAVLLQGPAGTFDEHPLQPALRFPGAGFRAVAVGHLRVGSGAPDLVVAQATAPPLLLWNDGSGRFAVAPAVLPPPPLPVARLLVGDLDQVPPEDILVLPEQGRPQLLLAQNGSHGDASQLLPVSLFVQSPTSAFADFDGDGDLDIVLASGVASAPFLLENRAGFLRQIALPVAGAFAGIAVGDFDGDRRADFAFARSAPAPSGVDFVLNRAVGFVAHRPASPMPLDAPPIRVRAADVLADGTTDVLVLQADGKVRVALNDGRAAFDLTHMPPVLGVGSRACLEAADLEPDGDLDLVAAGGLRNASAARDSLLLGRAGVADWLDTEAVGFPIGVLPGSGVAAAVDADGDAELDLVAYTPSGRGMAWRNDGSARFTAMPGALPLLAVADVRRVLRASIDGNGRDLVVVSSAAGGTAQPPGARLLVAQAGGFVDVTGRLPATFRRGFADVAAEPVLRTYAGPFLVDDLIVADAAGNLGVLANRNGGLQEVAGAFAPGASAAPVRAVLTGDVDGDRRRDVVLVEFGSSGGGLQVYLRTPGNVPPLFVEAPPPAVALGPVARALTHDLDGDGDLDVLCVLERSVAGPLLLLAGNGRGGFVDATTTSFTQPLPARVDTVALVTAPGGQLALLLGREDGEALALLRRQGSRFGPAERQPVHGSAAAAEIVVADFDTDGDDDCAVFATDSAPALLLGTDVHFAGRGIAQARREIALRARGPDASAIAAWLWSPSGTTRLVVPDLGVVRLAPPIVSLAVFPLGPGRLQDIVFPAPPTASAVTLAFQLAVYDTRSSALRLSNLEPLQLVPR